MTNMTRANALLTLCEAKSKELLTVDAFIKNAFEKSGGKFADVDAFTKAKGDDLMDDWLELASRTKLTERDVQTLVKGLYSHKNVKISEIVNTLAHLEASYGYDFPEVDGLFSTDYWKAFMKKHESDDTDEGFEVKGIVFAPNGDVVSDDDKPTDDEVKTLLKVIDIVGGTHVYYEATSHGKVATIANKKIKVQADLRLTGNMLKALSKLNLRWVSGQSKMYSVAY